MIRGISKKELSNFSLIEYDNIDEMITIIQNFFTRLPLN